MEQVEVHVLRDDASGKVTERIVRRYDPQGNPMPPVRETIEEQKRPDGSSTTQSTTYQRRHQREPADCRKDDHRYPHERLGRKLGNRRAASHRGWAPNGGEAAMRLIVKQPSGYQSETTTYRSDGNGGFYTAVRQTTEHTEQKASPPTAARSTSADLTANSSFTARPSPRPLRARTAPRMPWWISMDATFRAR